ncbi:hypothetical protein [Caballeronia sp. S22]|uniref:hypothetical protein n=1 Tax=Caballeronia sp. S22 TaxID=3137182 RepID=UPI0035316C71
MHIASLKNVRFSWWGSLPTAGQWQEVETALEDLFSLLNDAERRRFLLSQFPWWLPVAAVLSLVFVILSLVAVVFFEGLGLDSLFGFIPYVIWLVSMGALGAIAFVSMNLLSVQEDVTFDLTSGRMLVVRIIIGALFGLVLSLPFSWQVFWDFGDNIATSSHNDQRSLSSNERFPFFVPAPSTKPVSPPTSVSSTTSASSDASGKQRSEWEQAARLLLPFLLGFSTTLVILLLNRLISGVGAILGANQLLPNSGLQEQRRSVPESPRKKTNSFRKLSHRPKGTGTN